jgi:hypothetical protein
MRTPTWRASCRCFTACPPRGIPEVVSFRYWYRRDQELEGASNTRFRQVQAVMCIIPYVLFGGLYCLGCSCVLRGSLSALINPEGQGYMNPSPTLA